MNRPAGRARLRKSLLAASVATCFSLSSQHAPANPTGPSGLVNITGFSGLGTADLTIRTTGNSIANWQGFSIGASEITRILQDSAASASLHRVLAGGDVSRILGSLQSNGRVFLINPAGVVFGAGARIDVAGLVASSLALSDDDFLAGRMRFTPVAGAGSVVNERGSEINAAPGGRVFLVAPSVENSGIIRAPQGEILLAAGQSAELVNEASPFVTVKITADTQQALNVGSLIAESGKIGMYGALVRNSGIAEASAAVAGPGGQIRFVAAKDLTLDAGSRTIANGSSGGDVLLQAQGGTNLISGTVEAKGTSSNGGTVQALGVRVGVIGHGVIDASGETGGGSVMVGGDYQGKNPDVQNAQRTTIDSDGVIRADAGSSGDGGRVIVWSDESTQFYGTISARGGASSGNGGFVETSGNTSNAFGSVNVGAPNGKPGLWYLDPLDITFVSGVLSPGAVCGQTAVCFGDVYGSSVGVASIDAALAVYGGTVQAHAIRDINLNTDLILSNAGNVEALAGRDINLGTFSINIHGNLVARAGFAGSDVNGAAGAYGGGSINGTASSTVMTNGGSVDASAAFGTTGGNISIGSINSGMSRTTLNAGGKLTAYGLITANELVVTAANNGSASAGRLSLTTQVSSVQVTKTGTGSGGIELNNTGDLTLADLTGVGYAVSNMNGGVNMFTSGNMTVASTVIAGRRITLRAAGDATINAPLLADRVNQGFNVGVDAGGTVRAGDINTDGAPLFVSGNGGVVVGNINTARAGSSSLYGTWVSLESSNGSVTAGNITTGNGTSACCSDSDVFLSAGGNVTVGNIQTGSSGFSVIQTSVGGNLKIGNAVTGASQNGFSSVAYYAGGSITVGSITTGNSPNNRVTISNSSVPTLYGSAPVVFTGGDITTGAITTRSFDPNFNGGSVNISNNTGRIVVNGNIDTRGADGTAAHPDASSGGSVLIGGTSSTFDVNGNPIFDTKPASVSIGKPATFGSNEVVINTSGGNGVGTGYGGDAGNILIDPVNVTLNGSVFALGGSGSIGGRGGDLTFVTQGGTITFINGGYDLTGAANCGLTAGCNGILTTDGNLVFVTILSPFLVPEVAQAIGSTIGQLLSAAPTENKNEDTGDGKDKKGGFSSCKG